MGTENLMVELPHMHIMYTLVAAVVGMFEAWWIFTLYTPAGSLGVHWPVA